MFGTHDLWLFVLSGLFGVSYDCVDPKVAVFFSRISTRLAVSDQFKTRLHRCVGTVFVFAGVRLAFAHDH